MDKKNNLVKSCKKIIDEEIIKFVDLQKLKLTKTITCCGMFNLYIIILKNMNVYIEISSMDYYIHFYSTNINDSDNLDYSSDKSYLFEYKYYFNSTSELNNILKNIFNIIKNCISQYESLLKLLKK